MLVASLILAAAVSGLAAEVSLTVNGQAISLSVDPAQPFETSARSFVVSNKLTDPEDFDLNVRLVTNEIAKALGSQSDNFLGREVAVALDVDIGQEQPVKLKVFDGESAQAAAEGFCRRHGFPLSNAPAVAAAISRRASERQQSTHKPYLLFSFEVAVDEGNIGQFRLFSDQVGAEEAAAATFLSQAGFQSHPNYSGLLSGLTADVMDRVAELGSEAELANAAEAAAQEHLTAAVLARARAMAASGNASGTAFSFPDHSATQTRTISILIAGTSFDLEYNVGVDPAQMARDFCISQWDLLSPVLAQEMSTGKVQVDDCTSVLGSMMEAQMT